MTEEHIISKSLAVKHRPSTFKDLVGQNHAVSILRGMFTKKEFPGAFLIDGPTGTGKTTTARLIYRYLNCETGNACGKCGSCTVNPEASSDFINISAGVNGKVDEIRNLIKSARIAPYREKRVVVLDECHQLTAASAEALLVPIEEPASNTIWILCTTNPEKLKKTLINRCVRLTMKEVEPIDIAKHLGKIAKREGVDLTSTKEGKEALKFIASLSGGSLRTAISILESVLYASAGGADISNKDVITAYASSSDVDLDKGAASLVAAILNEDMKAAIHVIRACSNARGLVNKSRWLIDYLIGVETKSAKYTPYSGRIFNGLAKDRGITIKLGALLGLQASFVGAEVQMNSTSIPEDVLLQVAVYNYASE